MGSKDSLALSPEGAGVMAARRVLERKRYLERLKVPKNRLDFDIFVTEKTVCEQTKYTNFKDQVDFSDSCHIEVERLLSGKK